MLGVRPERDRGNPWVRAGWAAGLIGALLVSACSTPAPNPAEPTDVAVPPPPPAACLLDVGVFTTSTGVGWQPDQSTASDARCVYDPVAPAAATPGDSAGATSGPAGSSSVPDPTGFLAVEVAPVTAADPATELNSVAAVCAAGSRAPLAAGTGFVCRFRGGSTFAALVRTGQLVTVSVSAVPTGTTAARLVVGLQQQLEALGR